MMVRVKCHILSKLVTKEVNEVRIVCNNLRRTRAANMAVHANDLISIRHHNIEIVRNHQDRTVEPFSRIV